MRAIDSGGAGGTPSHAGGVPASVTYAFLVWLICFGVAWSLRYHPVPADIVAAAQQYLTWKSFSLQALLANWLSFFQGALIAGGVLAFGNLLGDRLSRFPGGERSFVGWSLVAKVSGGLGSLAIGLLGLGFLGLLYPPRPVVSCVIALVAGILAIRGSKRKSPGSGGSRSWADSDSPDRLLIIFALLVVAMGLVNIEMSWDALMYHLRLPSFYQYRHKVFDVWHHYYAVYPANVEMLFLAARMGQGDMAVRVILVCLSILLLLAVRDLSRDSGVSPSIPLQLLIGSPLVLILMSRSYVDIGLALFATLAIRSWLRWAGNGGTADAVAAGVFAGLAMGTKYIGVLLLPGLVAGSIGLAPRSRRGAAWGLVACATLLAPWLIKNWVFYGDPAAPFLGGLFGSGRGVPPEVVPIPWLHLTDPGSRGSLQVLLSQLVFGDGGVGGPYQPMVIAMLPLVFWGRLSGSAGLLRRFLLGYALVWLVLCPDIRFMLPAVPAYAILVTLRIETLFGGSPTASRAAHRVIRLGTALGVLFAGFVQWVQFNPLSLPLGLQSVQDKVLYSLYPIPFHGYFARYANTNLPSDARIMYLSHFNSYYVERECLNDFHFGRARLTEMLSEHPSVDGLSKRLRQLGVGWLLSTGGLARQYSRVPGYFDLSAREWLVLKGLLETRSEPAWQTDGLTLYKMSSPHPAHSIPSLPIADGTMLTSVDEANAAGRPADALAAMRHVPLLLADVGSYALREADCLSNLGRYRAACEAYRRASARGVDTPSFHGAYAVALLETGRQAEALPHAERAWTLHPLSANAAATYALALMRNGHREDALRMIRRAIDLRPDKIEYWQLASEWAKYP